ncbi:MAG: outer membrane protein assembly factor BamE [Rhodocyclales bacterium]|nr:outer membrane protein assembly factor BamE [Rhodocyclales bacterium]
MKRFLLFLPFLAACSSAPQLPQLPQITNYLSPYRIDVRQGNFVTQEMVAQLKPGLTRDQVRFILGSPLVADMFHADRWDYVYRYRHGREEVQQRTLTVFFVDNKLTRVAGDVVAEDGSKSEAPRPAAQVIEIHAPAAAGAAAEEKK